MNKKKILLIAILLSTYIIFNLLEGERGLISYYEKQETKKLLITEKEKLLVQLQLINKKNNLLTNNMDLDYLEILYRKNFMAGEEDEKIYVITR